jgi:hypothetical protein
LLNDGALEVALKLAFLRAAIGLGMCITLLSDFQIISKCNYI